MAFRASRSETVDAAGPFDEFDVAASFSPSAVRAVRRHEPDRPAELNPRAAVAADKYGSRSISAQMVSTAWTAVELAILVVVSLAAAMFTIAPHAPLVWGYVVVAVAGSTGCAAFVRAFGGYDVPSLRNGRLLPVVAGVALVLASLALGLGRLGFLDAASRAWLALWYAAGMAALLLARIAFRRTVRRWTGEGRLERRAVIVGGGAAAAELIGRVASEPECDVRICGIFDDRGDRRSPALVAGHPKLGNIRELVEFSRKARIDMLIVTIPLTAERRVLELLKSLWVLPLDIRLVVRRPQTARPGGSPAGELPLLAVFDKPIAGWSALAKRAFDLVVAAFAIVMLLPVFLGAALAIKLDSRGPILFRQKRHGFNNQIIEVLKFRSMFHDMADPAAARIVTRGDPRVTRVGRFIRKSSIDELPQLFNVLRGELSLVGPRPHAVHAQSSTNETFIEIVDDYFGRHKVKPGITGWAQVSGYRGEIDQPDKLKRRVELDFDYIDNWSIWRDVAILARTPLSLLRTENAY